MVTRKNALIFFSGFLSLIICTAAFAVDTPSSLATADQFYAIGNYARAQMLYEKVLDTGSLSAEVTSSVYFKLGRCYHYADRTDHAIRCFETVIDTYPGTSYTTSARKWLGDCYVIKNELDTAIAVYRSILTNSTDPQVIPAAKFELARTLFKIKDYTEAESEFDAFIKRYPSHMQVKQARFYLKRIQNITK